MGKVNRLDIGYDLGVLKKEGVFIKDKMVCFGVGAGVY